MAVSGVTPTVYIPSQFFAPNVPSTQAIAISLAARPEPAAAKQATEQVKATEPATTEVTPVSGTGTVDVYA